MGRAPDQRALFAVLGVDEHASWEELRRAFRDAVRASHPDLHASDPEAERRLKTLNAAWESVNTPGKWAAYVVRSGSTTTPDGSGSTPSSTVAPSLARLRVHRQRRGAAGLRRWKLELDGEVIASIENGGTSVLDTGPGRHSLRIFYETYSSPPLAVELQLGEELVLGCRQQEGLFVNLLSPKRSLALELLGSRRFA